MAPLYKTYHFKNKDPIIDLVRTAVKDSATSWAEIERRSGVTEKTLRNWFVGATRRPQTATVRAVLRAIGYDLTVTRQVKKS